MKRTIGRLVPVLALLLCLAATAAASSRPASGSSIAEIWGELDARGNDLFWQVAFCREDEFMQDMELVAPRLIDPLRRAWFSFLAARDAVLLRALAQYDEALGLGLLMAATAATARAADLLGGPADPVARLLDEDLSATGGPRGGSCRELLAFLEARETAIRLSRARSLLVGPSSEEPFPGWNARVAKAVAGLELPGPGAWRRRFREFWRRFAAPVSSRLETLREAFGIWSAAARYSAEPPLLDHERLERCRALLRPGDMLFFRANWHLVNTLLPGFWSHTAIYVGRPAELEAMGLLDDPGLAPLLRPWLEDAATDPPCVLEAVETGVRLVSLDESFPGDHLAALRPRLRPDEIREVLRKGLSQLGKSYDYDFDFANADRLICTELLHLAYGGEIRMPMWKVLGKAVLSPRAIVEAFDEDRRASRSRLDFVFFIDRPGSARRLVEASEDEFRRSCRRPWPFYDLRHLLLPIERKRP